MRFRLFSPSGWVGQEGLEASLTQIRYAGRRRRADGECLVQVGVADVGVDQAGWSAPPGVHIGAVHM